MSRKKRFSVEDFGGSIEACLNAMAKQGYMPVSRYEKPVFQQGKNGPEPIKQVIVFEGVAKDEH